MPLFEFPLSVDVYENGVAKRHHVWVKKQTLNSFEFSTNQASDLILVNANHDLIAEITQEFTTQENAHRYAWSKDEYTERMLAITELLAEQNISELAQNTLLSALDDPYFGIREQVLYSIDLKSFSEPNWIKKVEELAQNDPRTLVQAAAIMQLAKLEDPKYNKIFEKGLESISYSVQAESLLGIMKLDAEKAIGYSDRFDKEIYVNSHELLAAFIPHWKSQDNTNYLSSAAEFAAFYSFIAMQEDQSLARSSEEAFVWIMQTDHSEATQKVMEYQLQAYNQLKDLQPMALPFLKQMTERALRLKVQAAQNNPSPSMEKQVENIQSTLEKMN